MKIEYDPERDLLYIYFAEPEKKSATIPFSMQEAEIILSISFSGFCVGWSVFSDIDQKGTVKSVQILDGCVNL